MFIDVATVQERLDNFDALESQVQEDPADSAASAQLEHAYRVQGRTDELLQLLLTQAENVAETSERVELLQRAAEVCTSIDDAESALMILLTAFDLDRGNPDLADALDQLAYVTGQWDEVLDAYLIAAASSDDPERAGGLWLRIACAHAVITKDRDALAAALEHVTSVNTDWASAYLDLVEAQAGRKEVVLTLANVSARIGDNERCARCLTRAIAMSEAREEKAELHSQLSAIHLNNDDSLAANYHLREALRLDPNRADCQAALIEMSKDKGDIRGAADMLRSQALAGDAIQSEAAFEAAKLYSDLDENTRCFDLLSITMGEDPNHLGAAIPLAERHYQAKRWSELEPLLDLIIANKDTLPATEVPISEWYARAGECAEALDKEDRARDFFSYTLSLEPTHRKALEHTARVLQGLGDYKNAMLACDNLVVLQEEDPNHVRAITYNRMAEICLDQELLSDALGYATRATELDPSSSDYSVLLAKVHEAGGDFRRSIKVRQALIEHVSKDKQIELHCEIANIRCRKLDDPMGAIKEYERALAKRADDRLVMHSLFELFSAAEMWQDAIDVLLQIADVEQAPLRRGKYYDAAGDIIRRRIGDPRAVKCFNMALDCFFIDAKDLPENLRSGCMRPFHRIVEHLHAQEDYNQLERNYRKMIQRLDKDDPQVVHLWHELGNLYKGKLNRPEDAIASYEVVNSLDADSNHRRALLDLYEQSEEQLDKAIDQRHKLLEENPLESEHYNALCDLYLKINEPDRAWCATRALVFLGQASEAQKSFYYQNQPTEMRWPRVPIANSMWAQLRHPGENPLMSNILSLVADAMVADCAVDEAGLLARDGTSYLHNELRDLVRGVAFAMGMPPVRVTVDLELNADMLFLPTNAGPAFVVGRGIWQAPTARARVHAAASILACARPDAQLRQLSASPDHLEAVLMGAMTFVRPDIGVAPKIASQVAHIHQVMAKSLPPSRRVQLSHAVQALVVSGERHDSHKWWHAVDRTAQRVALLLSGDLQIAADYIRRESDRAEEGIADILSFSASASHGDMRRDLDTATCTNVA